MCSVSLMKQAEWMSLKKRGECLASYTITSWGGCSPVPIVVCTARRIQYLACYKSVICLVSAGGCSSSQLWRHIWQCQYAVSIHWYPLLLSHAAVWLSAFYYYYRQRMRKLSTVIQDFVHLSTRPALSCKSHLRTCYSCNIGTHFISGGILYKNQKHGLFIAFRNEDVMGSHDRFLPSL